MKHIALITGASSGIGREFVRQIASAYPSLDEIWVIARRGDALKALQEELPWKSLRILPLDLTLETHLERLEHKLREERPCIRILVNSAGCGKSGPVEAQDWRDACRMLDVNCRALTAVTMLCLPYLRKKSRIIQVDSGSAFLPQPGFAIYAASKAYVLSFDQALGAELKRRGISVTSVCPGPVDTEFFQNGGISLSPLKKLFLAKPGRVVRRALLDAQDRKPLSLYGASMRLVFWGARVVPQRVLLPLMARLFLKKM